MADKTWDWRASIVRDLRRGYFDMTSKRGEDMSNG